MCSLKRAPACNPIDHAAHQNEARRQQQLLDGLFEAGGARLQDARPGWARGLAAYRANAAAHASDALRAHYPTVLAMLGVEAFDSLAALHWRACPPTRGDLARFGEAFPSWLRQREDLTAWPWLGDCADLDRAMWLAGFAPPAGLRDTDLRLLAHGDPNALALRLASGTALVQADWAIVALRELHAASDPDVELISQTLQAPPQTAWVWHQGFESHCIALDAAVARWIRALREAPTLGDALEQVHDDFDVGAWLTAAVRAGWIDGVSAVTTEEYEQ